jgi:hypothetical protein
MTNLSPHLQRAHLHPPREIGKQSGHLHTTHTIFTTRPPRKLPGSTPCSRPRQSPPHPLLPSPPLPHLQTLKKARPPDLPPVRHMYPPLSRRFTRCRRPPLRRASTLPSRTSIPLSQGHPLQTAHTTSLRGSMRTRAHLRNLRDVTLPIYRSTSV